MIDPVALRAQKRHEARELAQRRKLERQRQAEQAELGGFEIKDRPRQILDTSSVETKQPLEPYTGRDHSADSMTSAVDFWHTHAMPTWMQDGLCRGMDQSIFYGDEDRAGKARHHPNLTVDEVAKARRICNSCPVQMECLDHAIRNREEFGIWGGSTAGQRKHWIKQFEERSYAYLDRDEDLDLTSYDEVYGGYAEDVDDHLEAQAI